METRKPLCLLFDGYVIRERPGSARLSIPLRQQLVDPGDRVVGTAMRSLGQNISPLTPITTLACPWRTLTLHDATFPIMTARTNCYRSGLTGFRA
jgi:hypothetical protein